MLSEDDKNEIITLMQIGKYEYLSFMDSNPGRWPEEDIKVREKELTQIIEKFKAYIKGK